MVAGPLPGNLPAAMPVKNEVAQFFGIFVQQMLELPARKWTAQLSVPVVPAENRVVFRKEPQAQQHGNPDERGVPAVAQQRKLHPGLSDDSGLKAQQHVKYVVLFGMRL